MYYSLKSAELWMHTLLVAKDLKPAPIIFKAEDKLDDAKIKCQEKQMEKILIWTKSNLKCKRYIRRIYAPHNQQDIQILKIDWLTKELWKQLKKRYILQNILSKWTTIVLINNLLYANYKNMIEYQSKYYTLKESIIEQSIIIEDTLKIRMLNNLGLAFKTYFTVVNNQMQKVKKLEEDETLFKAIEEEKT